MTRYRIEPSQSRVVIDARSSLHPIHSETDGLEGWVELDVLTDGRVNPASAPAGRVEFPVERLRSGNPLEDRELKRRIDAKRYPTIVGELESMGESVGDGRYLVQGNVTFIGVTRPSQDEMSIVLDGDGTVRLKGASTFDVRDFGMQPPRILMLRVFPDVKVAVDIVARKEA